MWPLTRVAALRDLSLEEEVQEEMCCEDRCRRKALSPRGRGWPAGPGEGSAARPGDSGNVREHGVFVFREVARGDADDVEPLCAERLIACGVFGAGACVLVAVEFDDEGGVGAVEVDDDASDRVLASELESCEAAVAQARPEDDFRR